jgi:hypothetical protein
MGSTTKVTIIGLPKYQPRCYVNMPRIPIITNHAFVIESKNMVENLAQPSFDEVAEFKNLESATQVALAHGCHTLMSLPHMLVKRTNGKEPLVEYYDFLKTFEDYGTKGNG